MTNKLKVGIFFGGQSREREISFLGGKTVFENLDKNLFEPILIFVDSLGNFILLNQELIYEEGIRDFYPSKNNNRGFKIYIESLGQLNETQLYKLIYKIGKQVKPDDFQSMFDFAFTIMHGPCGEDGSIQGLLEWFKIPYLGTGILGSAIGLDKPYQNRILEKATGQKKKFTVITKESWQNGDKSMIFGNLIKDIGFPLVIKAPHQGSSIGIAIIKKRSLFEFTKGMNQCFFEMILRKKDWEKISTRQKKNIVTKIGNLNEGIGYPLMINNETIYHPADLLKKLNEIFKNSDKVSLISANAEDHVLIEEFTEGQEFSVGVIQDGFDKNYLLPPTEIYSSGSNSFDFKSKYQSQTTKKRIPVKTSLENLEKIEDNVLKAFSLLGLSVVARIDGFLTSEDEVILHDPNTIPGMAPTSLIFKQMAEIGFNITDSLSYLIRQSIEARRHTGKETLILEEQLKGLDLSIARNLSGPKDRVGIIFGENEKEYKIAQKLYSQYASAEGKIPYLICAAKNGKNYSIPIRLIYKSNIEEFGSSIGNSNHPFINKIISKTEHIRKKYVFDFVQEVKQLDSQEIENLVNEKVFASEYL